MVAATIHLANRDWPSLIDDFVSLGFLPRWGRWLKGFYGFRIYDFSLLKP